MKRLVLLSFTIGVAAVTVACGEETSTATKDTNIVVAKDTDAITKETTASAKSTGTAVRETGTTRTAVNLMAGPFSDAKQAGQLPQNTTVEILERRGGWSRISGKGQTGWAKLYQVRTGTGPEATKSGEGVSILRNIGQTGRSGSQGIVATTGIRGLSAEDLKTAKPNPRAVEAMDAYRANDNTARQYAQSAGLKEKNVPFLGQ